MNKKPTYKSNCERHRKAASYALCTATSTKFGCDECVRSAGTEGWTIRYLYDVQLEFEGTLRKLDEDTLRGPMKGIHASLTAVTEAAGLVYDHNTLTSMAN